MKLENQGNGGQMLISRIYFLLSRGVWNMLKKLCFFIIFTLVLVLGSICVYAAPDGSSSAADKTTVEKASDTASDKTTDKDKASDTASTKVNDQNTDAQPAADLVMITRPSAGEKNSSNQTYRLCFITNYDNVHVDFQIKQDGKYVDLKGLDGESGWDIDTAGLNVKEFKLDKGSNDIRIVARRTYKEDGKTKVQSEEHYASITYVDITIEKAKDVKTDKTKTLDSISPFKK